MTGGETTVSALMAHMTASVLGPWYNWCQLRLSDLPCYWTWESPVPRQSDPTSTTWQKCDLTRLENKSTPSRLQTDLDKVESRV